MGDGFAEAADAGGRGVLLIEHSFVWYSNHNDQG